MTLLIRFFVIVPKSLLPRSVSDVLNLSYKRQNYSRVGNRPNIITLFPKEKPVKGISEQLRPILLTSALSKFAEDNAVEKSIAPAVLSTIDPFQF